MADALNLLSTAAGEAVQDISEPYEDYHADLVRVFAQALQILHTEPNERAERRAIENLIIDLASQISTKLEES